MSISVEIVPDLDEKTQSEIGDGLSSFNESKVGSDPSYPVWIVARDAQAATIGGIRGVVLWTWFALDWLWVSENARRQGVGKKLLERAEQAARDRECSGIFLSTFSFQAPEFYQKFGFQEFGRLNDFPKGSTRFWMCKHLDI